MTHRLVLWDIDGTLIRGGSIASAAFASAVERVTGRPVGEHGVVMAGKTDPQIAHEILVALGIDEGQASAHVDAVVEQLEVELANGAEQLRRGGRILAGVEALVRRLHDDADVVQSVLTGNTAANAAVKLAAFGLAKWIDVEVGAYGSDAADRRLLVPVAVERARRLRGFAGRASDVWVIGDTVRDHECAAAAGAHSLLVGTGRFGREELEGCGADVVLDDLADVERVLAIVRG